MAIKKGEGVRGVLGNIVSKDKEPKEQIAQSEEFAESPPEQQISPAEHSNEGQGAEHVEEPATLEPSFRKATGIKGRPRVKKDDHAAPKTEKKTKVTLSIDEGLREQFYRLAHGEMIQPGEYVERALRYFIKHHPKRD